MSTGTIERFETARLVVERLRPEHGTEECRLLLDPRIGADASTLPEDEDPAGADSADTLN